MSFFIYFCFVYFSLQVFGREHRPATGDGFEIREANWGSGSGAITYVLNPAGEVEDLLHKHVHAVFLRNLNW